MIIRHQCRHIRMKKLKIALLFSCFNGFLFSQNIYAGNIKESARTDDIENPVIVTGYNPGKKILTGYFSLSRPAPGSIDWCNFLFRGKVEETQTIALVLKNAVKDEGSASIAQSKPSRQSKGAIEISSGKNILNIEESELPGNCSWIFPDMNVQGISHVGTKYAVSWAGRQKGKWIAVSVISPKRAYFHDAPGDQSARKAFLVSGDVVYIYQEENDWLYVEYEGSKKNTAGWIKKSDTVQFLQ